MTLSRKQLAFVRERTGSRAAAVVHATSGTPIELLATGDARDAMEHMAATASDLFRERSCVAEAFDESFPESDTYFDTMILERSAHTYVFLALDAAAYLVLMSSSTNRPGAILASARLALRAATQVG